MLSRVDCPTRVIVLLGVVAFLVCSDVSFWSSPVSAAYIQSNYSDDFPVSQHSVAFGSTVQSGSLMLACVRNSNGANVPTFTDQNLPQDTNFGWRVIASNAVGDGVPSDEVCLSTAGVPGKVGGLIVIIQLVP